MRIRILISAVVIAAAGFAVASLAGEAAKAPAPAAAPAAAPALPTTWTPTQLKDIKWALFNPANPTGPQISVLWGDMAKGPVALLLKLPAGAKVPVHMHSNDYVGIVVSGKPQHGFKADAMKDDGPPGSSWFQPKKEMHADSCAGPEDCITVIINSGVPDFIPQEAPKTAAAAPKTK